MHRFVDNLFICIEENRLFFLRRQRHGFEGAFDDLNRDELVLLAWVRNALMVLSVLKWQLLVEEVLLLVNQVVDVLHAGHVLTERRCDFILMHHTLVGKKGAKHF